MPADELRRLLSSLDASFAAEIRRREDDAAFDLAFSLSQDVTFADHAARSGGASLILPSGSAMPIHEVAVDCVIGATSAEEVLILLTRAMVRSEPSLPPPKATGDRAVDLLRRLARAGTRVRVTGPGGSHEGVLHRAGSDHLLLRSKGATVAIGMAAIEDVRFPRRGG